jgi:hypothetical protein
MLHNAKCTGDLSGCCEGTDMKLLGNKQQDLEEFCGVALWQATAPQTWNEMGR